MSHLPVTHTLGQTQNTLMNNSGSLLHAHPVGEDADCNDCYFRNRKCPVTSLGCAACTSDVRDDKQNIVWQVVA